MQKIKYTLPMFARLVPRTDWRGGRITDTDLLTLDEAAAMASKHAGQEVTPADFLRAAGRGEITLRAIVHRAAKVRRHDDGVLFNAGASNENTVPEGSIPTLPLTACQHLAATGRACWRTFDGFEMIDGVLQRYTQGMLNDDEPDFETVPADCRVTGCDVHALADAFCEVEEAPATPPKVGAHHDTRKWTPELLQKLAAYRERYGTEIAAVEFGISSQRVRQLLPTEPAKGLPASPFDGLTRRRK